MNHILSGLYIVATPIGNLEDLTFRAKRILENADVIACEDKRKTSILLNHYGIKKELYIYNDFSDEKDRKKIDQLIANGCSVALVSDAGTPLISDPGYKLVQFLRKQDRYITTIPGPSSVISALTLSGLETNEFHFAGFMPKKIKQLEAKIESLNKINSSIIIFETKHTLKKNFGIYKENFSNRKIILVREITKIYEDVNNLLEIPPEKIDDFLLNIKGELILLIGPKKTDQTLGINDIENEITLNLSEMSTQDLSQMIANKYNLRKKEVYQKIISHKNGK